MVNKKLEVSRIINIQGAIPGKVRAEIYRLAKLKEFQHPEFIWKRMPIPSLRNRSNVTGRTNKTTNYTKKKVWCKSDRAGKPYYAKIGRYLNISEGLVWKYLNKGHDKMRKKYKNDKKYRDRQCNYHQENKDKILKQISETNAIRKEYYKNIDEDEKLKRMLELSNKLLYDPIAWKGKNHQHNTCIKCRKLLSRHNSRKMKGEYSKINNLRQNHCARCLMSAIAQLRMEIIHNK